MLIERFNDITIRHILNVQEYITISNGVEQSLRDITYFYINDNTLCIGFLINTIYGEVTVPVIGMKHIRVKNNIKYDLLEYLPKLEKKRKLNSYLILLYYTNLPLEMIEKIMFF
jgi:hypothetical protein